MTAPARRPFYYRATDGIRITVRPQFLAEHSNQLLRQFVFGYMVRIENVGLLQAQLLSRYWLIHDNAGEDQEVRGDGVIGVQPLLAPGGVHEYSSFAVLRSPSGWMEGAYQFTYADERRFEALIPRFYLDASESEA